jgi:hypothetical protein
LGSALTLESDSHFFFPFSFFFRKSLILTLTGLTSDFYPPHFAAQVAVTAGVYAMPGSAYIFEGRQIYKYILVCHPGVYSFLSHSMSQSMIAAKTFCSHTSVDFNLLILTKSLFRKRTV